MFEATIRYLGRGFEYLGRARVPWRVGLELLAEEGWGNWEKGLEYLKTGMLGSLGDGG